MKVRGYEVTVDGKVMSNQNKGKPLTPWVSNSGYLMVQTSHKGVAKKMLVHRMVAEAHLPNPEGKPHINHKDGNKLNNHVDNLEWVTMKENHDHARANGLKPPKHPVVIYCDSLHDAAELLGCSRGAVYNATKRGFKIKGREVRDGCIS